MMIGTKQWIDMTSDWRKIMKNFQKIYFYLYFEVKCSLGKLASFNPNGRWFDL